jgi:hypothetical protein
VTIASIALFDDKDSPVKAENAQLDDAESGDGHDQVDVLELWSISRWFRPDIADGDSLLWRREQSRHSIQSLKSASEGS